MNQTNTLTISFQARGLEYQRIFHMSDQQYLDFVHRLDSLGFRPHPREQTGVVNDDRAVVLVLHYSSAPATTADEALAAVNEALEVENPVDADWIDCG